MAEYWKNGQRYIIPDPTPSELAEMQRVQEEQEKAYWTNISYEDAVNGGDVYKVGYQPGEEYQKFIDQMIKDSDVDTGVKPQTSNKILTLSTCTGTDTASGLPSMQSALTHRLRMSQN